MLQPQIILLRDGTDTSQGKGQLLSNIGACLTVVDAIRTTLGPRGLDKLITDRNGKSTISNDGATLMALLEIEHPAAKTLVDIARAQDMEVGDGTTSVVILAGELLKACKTYIEEGVHPQAVIKAYREALRLITPKIKEIAYAVKGRDDAEFRDMLIQCGATALNSKLIAGQKEFFSELVVDTVLALDESLDMKMIGLKKVPGGNVKDSFMVKGVAFKKTFSYAGFEQQPKSFTNPKIILLNVELELKAEKDNAEVRVSDPAEYQAIVDAEWSIIYEKLDNIIKTGAKIVLSKLPIGDLATQYFADRDIFCAGRVENDDLNRVAMATGAQVQSTVNGLTDAVIGSCGSFEERQLGGERFNIFQDCEAAKTATIVIRGGAEQFIAETERSLNDSIMIVRRCVQHSAVVGGGGAIEMVLSKFLREQARSIHGKSQLLVTAYAKALEVIPRQLSENAGFDATEVLNKLRFAHAKSKDEDGTCWQGVDVDAETGGITDTFKKFVWEPSVVKLNALAAATEAACNILSVDQTVVNPQAEKPDMANYNANGGAGRGRGRGAPGGGRGIRRFQGRGGR